MPSLGRLHLITDTRPGRDPLAVLRAALAGGPRRAGRPGPGRGRRHRPRGVRPGPPGARALRAVRGDLPGQRPAARGARGGRRTAATSARTTCPSAAARRVLGPDAVLGATARDPGRPGAAVAAGASYLGVGPCHATSHQGRAAGADRPGRGPRGRRRGRRAGDRHRRGDRRPGAGAAGRRGVRGGGGRRASPPPPTRPRATAELLASAGVLTPTRYAPGRRCRGGGGGPIGLAIAWRCAARGLRVVVHDPAPGSGASAVAAGMLAPVAEAYFGERELTGLLVESAARWPAFAAELTEATGADIGYRTEGTLVVGLTARRPGRGAPALGVPAGAGSADRRRCAPRSCATASRRWPPGCAAARSPPGDHQVDPRRLVPALRAAGGRAGAVLVPGRVRRLSELDAADHGGGRRLRAGRR